MKDKRGNLERSLKCRETNLGKMLDWIKEINIAVVFNQYSSHTPREY